MLSCQEFAPIPPGLTIAVIQCYGLGIFVPFVAYPHGPHMSDQPYAPSSSPPKKRRIETQIHRRRKILVRSPLESEWEIAPVPRHEEQPLPLKPHTEN